ncbi:hypothetical protein C8R48DRAFT_772050 [Suillus tomentosus]|nr:hypothetical protein C8R48DRAFT_772840 [Suillus tomentosus]KAG1867562.1 hypothetical protein C8R48DRAFT_772050 [Suillus tomentosus]
MNQGIVGSMRQLGVTESYKLKRQVVLSASEAAEMIIRVDDILRVTPRKREAPDSEVKDRPAKATGYEACVQAVMACSVLQLYHLQLLDNSMGESAPDH